MKTLSFDEMQAVNGGDASTVICNTTAGLIGAIWEGAVTGALVGTTGAGLIGAVVGAVVGAVISSAAC